MSYFNKVKVHYSLSMREPKSGYFEVGVRFSGLPATLKKIDLVLPVWRPGRYLIFDFASGVQEFTATGNKSRKLTWSKPNKTTWNIQTEGSTSVSIKYKVFGNEFTTRTRGLDLSHAFINGTAVFMFDEKFRRNPVTLEVKPYGDWHITTGLDTAGKNPNKFTAPNYDYLVDCPLEIGSQTDFDFFVEGIRHTISIFGNADYNSQKLIDDFSKIIKKNYEFWGSVPYKRYVFIIHCTPASGGGTEHINSTIVGAKPQQFSSQSGYEAFLRLISHEFFHTWNVKQMKPKGLTPYDFTKENYTSELWIAEGGTSYYDGLMITRTGQMSVEEFHKEITKGVEDEKSRPGNRIQSVADSSFDAWVKFWRRTPNAYNSESDYYAKGSYVNLLLDLEIRNSSRNRYSLDNVYRTMFEKYPLDKKGYTNDDFRKMCEKYAGKDLRKFFDEYVYGVKPLDWKRYLSYAGLTLKSDRNAVIHAVGIRPIQKDGKVIINEVIKNSAAEKSGLAPGDEIIALNGLRVSFPEMEKSIKEMKKGDSVKLALIRNSRLFVSELTFAETKTMNYFVEKVKYPTVLQKNIYESWLETKW